MSKINKDHQFCLLTDMMVAEKSPIKLHKKHYEPNLLAERVLSSSDTKLAAPGVRLPEEDEMMIMVLMRIIDYAVDDDHGDHAVDDDLGDHGVEDDGHFRLATLNV